MAAAVVGCREHGEQLSAGETLEAVHDTLVRAEDIFSLIVVEELFDTVGAELHDVAGAIRVTDEVRLDA